MAFKGSPACFFKGSRARESRWRVRKGKDLKGGGKQRKGRDNIEGSELFFWMENILWLKKKSLIKAGRVLGCGRGTDGKCLALESH